MFSRQCRTEGPVFSWYTGINNLNFFTALFFHCNYVAGVIFHFLQPRAGSLCQRTGRAVCADGSAHTPPMARICVSQICIFFEFGICFRANVGPRALFFRCAYVAGVICHFLQPRAGSLCQRTGRAGCVQGSGHTPRMGRIGVSDLCILLSSEFIFHQCRPEGPVFRCDYVAGVMYNLLQPRAGSLCQRTGRAGYVRGSPDPPRMGRIGV